VEVAAYLCARIRCKRGISGLGRESKSEKRKGGSSSPVRGKKRLQASLVAAALPIRARPLFAVAFAFPSFTDQLLVLQASNYPMTSRARAWAYVTLQPRTDKPRNIHGGRVLSRQRVIAVQMTDFHIADSRRSPVIYGSTTRPPGVKFSNDFSRACVGVYSRIPNRGPLLTT